jgi:hypothetical protein
MALYCSRAIFEALRKLKYPASKAALLECAAEADASEATLVSLNSLPEGVIFEHIEAVCDNVSIVCSLEVYRALQRMAFPATREQILKHAANVGASPVARAALAELAGDYAFGSVEDVCRLILL